MKFLIMLMLLVGCGKKCPEIKYRSYKYEDKVTITSGFYKGQKGVITNKNVWVEDNLCTSPSFSVKLEEGKEVHLKQNYLFVESEEEKTTVICKVVEKEEKKKCKPCIKSKQPEPKEEKKPSSCVKKIEEEVKNCKGINCKIKLVIKLRKCPDFNQE